MYVRPKDKVKSQKWHSLDYCNPYSHNCSYLHLPPQDKSYQQSKNAKELTGINPLPVNCQLMGEREITVFTCVTSAESTRFQIALHPIVQWPRIVYVGHRVKERDGHLKKIVGEKSEQGWYEVGGKSSQNARDTYVKL